MTTNATKEERIPQGTGSVGKHNHPNAASTIISNTIRFPQWTYFHLSFFSSTKEPELDAITARTHMDAAMTRFLGLTGSAIPIDILKLEGTDLWVRVPREHANAFHEGLSSWSNNSSKYIVKGRDDWLLKLVHGTAEKLFQ
jgi:ribonuclease P/MRP protein subunit POP8